MRQLTAVLLLALSVCSHYHVVGTTHPFGIQRLALMPFVEDVPIGAAPDLLQALAEELAQSGFTLTADPSTADALLRGAIVGANTGANLSAGGITTYSLSLHVRAELLDRHQQTLWSTQVGVGEEFPYAGSALDPALGTEANRRVSATRLAREAARAIHLRLMLAGDRSSDGWKQE